MAKPNLREILRYRFDNTLSRGTAAVISWLALVTSLLVVLAGSILVFSGLRPDATASESMDLKEGIWQSLMRVLDAGTVTGDEGWMFRLFMLGVTIAGLFLFSTLIATISSGIDERISDLRKGKSRVLETGHTLVLGYGSMIHTILSELCIANESKKGAAIVVLANEDKVAMEDECRARIPDTRGTRIIFRSGNPLDIADLHMVSHNEARAIILIGPEAEQEPDNHVIKSVLSITGARTRKKNPYNIVVEIKNSKNREVSHMVGGKEVSYIFSDDLIARLTAQTSRQSGLSIVYSELLQFEGDELYFFTDRGLYGITYQEAQLSFEDCCAIGIFTSSGQVQLNPPAGVTLSAGDQLILIAADDSKIRRLPQPATPTNLPLAGTGWQVGQVESTLILGWNLKGRSIVKELDHYVPKGSSVCVVADFEGMEVMLEHLAGDLENLSLHVQRGDINDRNTLDELNVPSFHHIIVLSDLDKEDIQVADAITLICLLHLRDISEKAGKDFSVVSEMRDIRNRELAEVARADDFIVSNNLLSLLMTQIAENKNLEQVFTCLFNSEGSEIYLRPVEEYFPVPQVLDFYQVTAALSAIGQTALGYRTQGSSQQENTAYGIVLNPLKSRSISFSAGDRLIVLAEG